MEVSLENIEFQLLLDQNNSHAKLVHFREACSEPPVVLGLTSVFLLYHSIFTETKYCFLFYVYYEISSETLGGFPKVKVTKVTEQGSNPVLLT